MPAATTTTTTDRANNDYLRDLPPAWAALQGGLSIFAAVVILRFCIHRLRSWRSRSDSSGPRHIKARKTVAWQDARDTDQLPPPPEKSDWGAHQYQYRPASMDEKERSRGGSGGNGIRDGHVSFSSDEPAVSRGPLPVDPRYKPGSDGLLRHLISRPPPAPPLTPPELSSTVFTLEARPHSQDSLIHQPNPDYTSPSTTSSGSQPSTIATTSHPRRLSYNKTVPIGMPVSRQSSASESDLFFSPSSYPPTSPLLPPAPPTTLAQPAPDDDSPDRKEIELRGEIVGVLDANGVGWSRHTRVYGGGVCLACAAAGREHGEGGFYGPNVLPEEMR